MAPALANALGAVASSGAHQTCGPGEPRRHVAAYRNALGGAFAIVEGLPRHAVICPPVDLLHVSTSHNELLAEVDVEHRNGREIDRGTTVAFAVLPSSSIDRLRVIERVAIRTAQPWGPDGCCPLPPVCSLASSASDPSRSGPVEVHVALTDLGANHVQVDTTNPRRRRRGQDHNHHYRDQPALALLLIAGDAALPPIVI